MLWLMRLLSLLPSVLQLGQIDPVDHEHWWAHQHSRTGEDPRDTNRDNRKDLQWVEAGPNEADPHRDPHHKGEQRGRDNAQTDKGQQ
jgi:hypothetical protein